MKYKLIGIACFIAVIAIVFLGSYLMAEEDPERVHQHLAVQKKPSCNHTNGEFCTHLPLVLIETGGRFIPGMPTGEKDRFNEDEISLTSTGETMETVTISVFDSQSKNNHLSDVPTFKTNTLIRQRGHASRSFEKAQYLLKFTNEDGTENNISVMGMDSHNEWILNGPYLDKSLIRNYMWYNISGEIMQWAPNVRYCELFVDNDYKGIYLMLESISNGDNCRLNLTVTQKGTTVSGYLYRLDRISEADIGTVREIFPFSERSSHIRTDIALRFPGKNKLTPDLAKEIESEISHFEKALYSYDYDSKKYGFKNYVDIQSAVDYFLICEMTKNMDMGRYSTYVYKQPSEKYKFCVWDFNNALDNFPSERDITGVKGFSIVDKPYFEVFVRDEEFTSRAIERYKQLRQGILSEDALMAYIDKTLLYLGDAIGRNSIRWQHYIQSDEALAPVERNVHSQQEGVEQYREFIIERGRWLDDNIDTLKQYSAQSKIKQFKEVTE